MSQAVVHNGIVYTAGQVADGADITEQTWAVLGKIDALLEEVGSHKGKLLSATIWIADMSDFAAMNQVWDAWVIPGETPARACTQAALARPELIVEISVIAALDAA